MNTLALSQGLADVFAAVLIGAWHHLGECVHNDQVVWFARLNVADQVGDHRRLEQVRRQVADHVHVNV
ncbi:hypothetical protein D3C86_1624510 [compost metagenome]